MSDPGYTDAQKRALRKRYVLDRLDGKPILSGRADCPECEVALRLKPFGELDLRDDVVRYHLHLECDDCGRGLDVVEDFEWGP